MALQLGTVTHYQCVAMVTHGRTNDKTEDPGYGNNIVQIVHFSTPFIQISSAEKTTWKRVEGSAYSDHLGANQSRGKVGFGANSFPEGTLVCMQNGGATGERCEDQVRIRWLA